MVGSGVSCPRLLSVGHSHDRSALPRDFGMGHRAAVPRSSRLGHPASSRSCSSPYSHPSTLSFFHRSLRPDPSARHPCALFHQSSMLSRQCCLAHHPVRLTHPSTRSRPLHSSRRLQLSCMSCQPLKLVPMSLPWSSATRCTVVRPLNATMTGREAEKGYWKEIIRGTSKPSSMSTYTSMCRCPQARR